MKFVPSLSLRIFVILIFLSSYLPVSFASEEPKSLEDFLQRNGRIKQVWDDLSDEQKQSLQQQFSTRKDRQGALANRGVNALIDPDDAWAKGRLIVKFKSGDAGGLAPNAGIRLQSGETYDNVIEADSIKALNRRFNVKSIRPMLLSTVTPRRSFFAVPGISTNTSRQDVDTFVFEVDETADIKTVSDVYADDPHVEYAQPDYVVRSHFTPNDPFYHSFGTWGQNYSDLWGVKRVGSDVAWDATQGEGIVVAVVDSGVDWQHPDLSANIWRNPGETVNGFDDDGNGYVDDVRGFDFSTCAFFSPFGCLAFKDYDNDPMDGSGHGTHVAGTIAAVGNNALGVIGVAPKVKIMPIKALSDEGGGFISDIATAIRYAADKGADVMNNSWGCADRCPSNPVAEDAIRYAYNKGVAIIFSAGNENDEISYYSPQNMSQTIVVGATDINDQRTLFDPNDPFSGSNFGSGLDVVAPGVDILSLNARSGNNAIAQQRPDLVIQTHYLRISGTSMAAPHASGVAALILSESPGLSPSQVCQALRDSAEDLGPNGWDADTGYGLIDAGGTFVGVNRAPVINPISDRVIDEEEFLQLNITATDPEGMFVAISARMSNGQPVSSVGAEFVDFGDSAARLTWQPQQGQGGENYTFIFTAEDPEGLADDESVSVTVVRLANEPPVMTPIGAKTGIVGKELAFPVTATDPDGDELTFSASRLPDGAEFNPATQTFRWTPEVGDGGQHSAAFRVEDPAGLSDTISVNITINEPATMVSPAPGSQLNSSTVRFSWKAGYGATGYRLLVGTSPGAGDLFNQSVGTSLSQQVTNIPVNGNSIYVRLDSRIQSSWVSRSYTYQTMPDYDELLRRLMEWLRRLFGGQNQTMKFRFFR